VLTNLNSSFDDGIDWMLSIFHLAAAAEAVNGLDVIEKARTLSPDLVVMDVSMPVMNGIEAGSVLKVMLPQVPAAQ
jgi:YesN/AraC family two-component response regulator